MQIIGLQQKKTIIKKPTTQIVNVSTVLHFLFEDFLNPDFKNVLARF